LSDELSICSQYDRFFDGWRNTKTETAKALVTQVITGTEDYERSSPLRQRRRKAAAQTTFEATVEAVILDIAHAFLSNDDRPLVVPRSRRVLDIKDQYTPAIQGRMLPQVLDLLERAGWLHQTLGEYRARGRNQRTILCPTSQLIQAIEQHGLTLLDIGRSKVEEVVVLKSVKEDYWDKGAYVPYDDNEDTQRIRQQVQTINDWISGSHIEFDNAALEQNISVDPSDTRLRRYFSRYSFQSGGRLFGGFWQRLSENERLNGILIDGEEVAEVDYGQIAARILYGLAGVQVPEGDLYEIPGLTRINGESYRGVCTWCAPSCESEVCA
jgi:hypothetical protein